MADRITGIEEQQIISLYAQYGSYNRVAKELNRSHHVIKKIVLKSPTKSNKVQQKVKEEEETTFSAENLLMKKMEDLKQISNAAMNKLKEMVENPIKYNVSAQDLIKIYKLQGDTIYQLKNIALKERDVIVKEKLANKILNQDVLDENEVANIINDAPIINNGDNND